MKNVDFTQSQINALSSLTVMERWFYRYFQQKFHAIAGASNDA